MERIEEDDYDSEWRDERNLESDDEVIEYLEKEKKAEIISLMKKNIK